MINCTPNYLLPYYFFNRNRLTRNHRFINIAVPFNHLTIDWHTLTRTNFYNSSTDHFGNCNFHYLSMTLNAGSFWLHSHQMLNRL
ncbi:Uncharacterised protein [Acinetobacter baumannii]|nr:Uncharacterised protein [Acinetobacter baumannii]